MKKLFLILLTMFAVGTVAAQQTIKSDNIGGFKSVSLSGKLYVEMILSDKNAIEIQLIEATTDKVKWGVNNEELSVSFVNTPIKTKGSAKVTIYFTKLDNITVSGAELIVKDILSADLMTIKLVSSAKITVDCECDDIAISATGNSVGKIGGITKYMTLKATEFSKVEAVSLKSVSADVECTTGAEVYVAASERLAATALTGSSIFYKGKPSILRTTMTKNTIGLGGSINNIGQ